MSNQPNDYAQNVEQFGRIAFVIRSRTRRSNTTSRSRSLHAYIPSLGCQWDHRFLPLTPRIAARKALDHRQHGLTLAHQARLLSPFVPGDQRIRKSLSVCAKFPASSAWIGDSFFGFENASGDRQKSGREILNCPILPDSLFVMEPIQTCGR